MTQSINDVVLAFVRHHDTKIRVFDTEGSYYWTEEVDVIKLAGQVFHRPFQYDDGGLSFYEPQCHVKTKDSGIYLERGVAEKLLRPCARCYTGT
jgi:hypothetical protein